MGRIGFILALIFVSFLGIILFTEMPVFSINAQDQRFDPQAFLPMVMRQYDNAPPTPTPTSTPVPPPRVVIDSVPPFTDYHVIGTGHVTNVDLIKHPLNLTMIGWTDEESGWEILSNGFTCDPPPPPPPLIDCSTGNFNFMFGPLDVGLIQKFRFYLTEPSYSVGPGGGFQHDTRGKLYSLPPDPPTSDIWAMTEVVRSYPDQWEITVQKP